jgi:dTDP-4-amino-4,6-dideoxygalactose transaminase
MKFIVPFIDYAKEYRIVRREINFNIRHALSRGDVMRGTIGLFEREFADYLGVRNCVALNSGTDALFFALKSLIKEGDEVITVSWTFIATIAAIKHCGAVPILIDIGDDMVMDTDLLEAAITPKTKAILPVHLNGQVVNMDKVMEVARKHNLYVIEDAAQAVGANLGEKKAGTIGDVGCFSFYPAKILGCYGDGGALVTNNDDIAEEARLMRTHYEVKGVVSTSMKYGWNSRLDNIQAIVLREKLNHLEKSIKRRSRIAEMYDEGIKEFKLPPKQPVYQNYVIRTENRDRLYNYLLDNGVEPMIRDRIPYHLIRGLELSHFSLPKTEKFAQQVISLPIFPLMSDYQVNHVIKTLQRYHELFSG